MASAWLRRNVRRVCDGGLANEATELYAKTALLELAAEFRESAERLEQPHAGTKRAIYI
jgi:hypothetical protein